MKKIKLFDKEQKILHKVLCVTISTILPFLIKVNPSKAATIFFEQTNYSGGGTLSGEFSGVDENQDGLLVGEELSFFNLNFSGDSIVGDINQTYSSTDFLQPVLVNGELKNNSFSFSKSTKELDFDLAYDYNDDGNGDGIIIYTWTFAIQPFPEPPMRVSLGSVSDGEVLTESTTGLQLAHAPEPSSIFALLGLGLGTLIFRNKKQA
ncbi:PEP-CTERM sorting domain-containing protein [Okeania sp. SIO1I7]|uniref:PEP-CTERM sorting domain-containing protein n=1 Tax=Okeania sp. SIO1I7 TaxID=2607772 RepID=UPI0013F8A1CC|nr:PEP-CTERM sorting domain-containing protein [Okeania sp. SIO1I7]NET29968.1 PEP-CTERM sorting domain-containing protein [Okeania sp. SIO1I7]